MNQWVTVQIPVSPAAAEALREDPRKLTLAGKLVSDALRPAEAGSDSLFRLLATLPREPGLPELTAEDIQAEIDAARAESRP